MLLNFFEELYDLVIEENEYLKENDEIDAEHIQNITMKKNAIQDKIERYQVYMKDTGEELSGADKETVKNIIENIIATENDNREFYKIKMEFIKKSLGSLHKERQVKTTYIKSGMKMSNFDTKK
jgi:Na+/phosphate symporter